MRCNQLPFPDLRKVVELGIDRANEVELLCAPPARGSVVENPEQHG